jgi:hypothetical protein
MGFNLGDYILKLHLGFDSVPYSYPPKSTRKGRISPGYGAGKTTAQVAKELEQTYGIVEAFYNMEEDYLVRKIEDVMGEELEEVITMSRTTRKKAISDETTDLIEARFRRDLAARKYDGIIPNVPTTSSLRGVSHLRRHPYAKRGPRPSFIDTGLYRASFRAWVEED